MEEAEKAWTSGDGFALWIAAVHAPLWEKDAAFEWVVQERSTLMAYLRMHHFFTNLRGDPRFDSLVKRMGVSD